MWDPGQYQRFGDERSRPFFDLVQRVGAEDPRFVADLGCGPGNLTAALARRWPRAQVLGVDSAPEMIEAARAHRAGLDRDTAARLSFAVSDVRDWQPEHQADVIVSNAVLQWVPGYREVLGRWAGFLPAGGWLAIQVPGNLDQPGHVALRELAALDRWRGPLAGIQLNRQTSDPVQYLELLAGAGLEVDAWETTYVHVLHGDDPVLEWYRGTGLRPVLAALPPGLAADFLAAYAARMREAYPPTRYGTPFPFRRVFAVAARR